MIVVEGSSRDAVSVKAAEREPVEEEGRAREAMGGAVLILVVFFLLSLFLEGVGIGGSGGSVSAISRDLYPYCLVELKSMKKK